MRTWPALEVGRSNIRDTGTDPTDEDLIHAALLDHDVAAIEELPQSWRVFFHTSLARDNAAAALRLALVDIPIASIDVPDEDWAARSQASLTAVTVGHLVIAPPWDIPQVRLEPDATQVIVIQPSMGFGTGHHATTRLCLAALQALDLRDTRVLDVGTGSGVLAIAASLLGAASVMAIDSDPDAVHAARENLQLNPWAAVSLEIANLETIAAGRFDVVLANLTGGLLIHAAERLHALTAANGLLVLSGFMHHEEDAVRAAYSDLVIRARAEEDEWVCVSFSSPYSS